MVYQTLLDYKKKNKLSWKELAEYIGISEMTIRKFNKGTTPNNITRQRLLQLGLITKEQVALLDKEWYDKVHARRWRNG